MKRKNTNKSKNSTLTFKLNENVQVTRKKRTDVKYDLSIALITKNEEKYLERCLKSLARLKEEINCEIIVTDTGSTDKTVEIAEKYADKVLHFVWCDDFSAARNTGVEVSEGAWFMFVDADEIFDDSIYEISKFINSKDRDNYDNASNIIRNYYKENDKSNYSDFIATRLFNFQIEKRYFQFKIHESIPAYTGLRLQLKSVADHYGYLEEVLVNKNNRNIILMEDELNDYPNNVRTLKHLMCSVDLVRKIELYEVFLKNIMIQYNTNKDKIDFIDYTPVIYVVLGYAYCKNKKFDEIIELFNDFNNSQYFEDYNLENNTPRREMHYLNASAYFEKKEYSKAIPSFEKFRYLYNLIEKKPDDTYSGFHSYVFGTLNFYYQVLFDELLCYEYLNDTQNLVKLLNDDKIIRYEPTMNLTKYFYFIIKYKQKSCAKQVIDLYSEKVNIYNTSESYLLFCVKLLVLNDIDDYLKNCDIDKLLTYISIFFNDSNVYKFEALYNLIIEKKEFSDLKEMVLYLNLMEKYIIVHSKNLINQDNVSDEKLIIENTQLEKLKVNEIFEIYVKQMYLYVKTVYNDKILENEDYDLLLDQEAFCYLVYPTLEDKNSNQLEYIKMLKKGLVFCKKLKNVITNTIYCLQIENSDSETDSKVENNEFQLLGEKIKLAIIEAIKSNEIDKAKLIIDEYKKINPDDSDIQNLLNVIS